MNHRSEEKMIILYKWKAQILVQVIYSERIYGVMQAIEVTFRLSKKCNQKTSYSYIRVNHLFLLRFLSVPFVYHDLLCLWFPKKIKLFYSWYGRGVRLHKSGIKRKQKIIISSILYLSILHRNTLSQQKRYILK